ncbi:MAG: ABC transporter substrate-binding protein [Gammaproteobacteria bacterium]|nr:ABC transporter substrate-binding protein [Gammaproteobacteria bacterium]
MKKIALLMLFFWLPFMAQATGYSAPQELSGLEEPARVLRGGVESLTGYLGDNQGVPPERLHAFLEQEIAPYFDFDRMAFWAAGETNRYLDPGQRQQLTVMLRERFLQTMAQQLSGYKQSRIQYLRPRGNPRRGDVTLGVRVFGAESYPVQIDFKLYRGRAGWKVYDVVANGVSAVAHYRSEFAQLVNRYGVEGFLAGLAR